MGREWLGDSVDPKLHIVETHLGMAWSLCVGVGKGASALKLLSVDGHLEDSGLMVSVCCLSDELIVVSRGMLGLS